MSYSARLALAVCLLPALAGAQNLVATRWISGLSSPIAVMQDPTNPNVQLVIQQGGTIRTIVNGVLQATPFMTISVVTGSERGLLGIAFDPDYATNGYFYLYYTSPGVYMQLSRFKRDPLDPLKGDPTSETHILRTLRPYTNHNSGTIRFGQDGYLYFPTGDGGSGGDPENRAQNPQELLGKMLRIDVHGDDFPADPEANYHIPADNPFVDGIPISARNEIWSFGYRNAFKFSFDDPKMLGTGGMLVADVGQNLWEELDYEPANAGGRNYGWSVYEGFSVYNGSRSLAYQPHQPPYYVYDHSQGNAVIGGYVYRGLALGPQSFGRYFFADEGSSNFWSAGLIIDPVTGEASLGDVTKHTSELGASLGNPCSIDIDSNGELLVVSYGGGAIYKITRANSTWLTDVGRADGVITGGQIRSLVAADGKSLKISPFSPTFTNNKTTALVVGATTNVASPTTLTVDVEGRVNQALQVPATVKVKNWTTGLYDTAGTFNLTGTQAVNTVSITATDHVRPADKRIEVRIETAYAGVLLQPILDVLYDRVTPKVS